MEHNKAIHAAKARENFVNKVLRALHSEKVYVAPIPVSLTKEYEIMQGAEHIIKAVDGPLKGFDTLPIDRQKLLDGLAKCKSVPVHYGMGSKAHEPFSFPPDFTRIDCSGFVRWLIFHATGGQVLIPDGSYIQADDFQKYGFKKGLYADAANKDNHVRICFHRPGGRGGDGIGHVWIVLNGETLESYGGHGPGSRPFNHQWFLDHVDVVYVLS